MTKMKLARLIGQLLGVISISLLSATRSVAESAIVDITGENAGDLSFSITTTVLPDPALTTVRFRVQRKGSTPNQLSASLTMIDESGRVVARVEMGKIPPEGGTLSASIDPKFLSKSKLEIIETPPPRSDTRIFPASSTIYRLALASAGTKGK